MTPPKPTGVLLRVSTNMQANVVDNEADIPTQRTACLRFIEQHPEWQFVKEYREIGVSGYKNGIAQRDKLLEVREDIAAGTIRVLVVFMFDRLGRIEEETPFVVKSFVDMGCEVWSVQEGQRKFEAHVDSLLNFITFWQASGESKKTSERVTNTMNQMAESGRYTGGPPPYGYTTVPTGRTTKKKLPEKRLAPHEDEAAVVRLIYRLALQRDYGCHRIAAHLNDHGIPTRSGKQWGHAVVANILTNPVYKGIRCYNRTTTKGAKTQKRQSPEHWITGPFDATLALIPAADWDLLQARRQQRAAAQPAYPTTTTGYCPPKSTLLLAGLAHCGACGARLYTGYSPYRWTTKDGVTHRRSKPVYRCGTQSTGRRGCTGPPSHRPERFEPAVLRAVTHYLDALPTVDLAEALRDRQREGTARQQRALRDLAKQAADLQRELHALEDRYVKALTAGDEAEQHLLQRLIAGREQRLEEQRTRGTAALQEHRDHLAQLDHLVAAQRFTPRWSEVFRQADPDTQKTILRTLIDHVDVTREQIRIHWRLSRSDYEQPAPGS